MNIPKDYTIIGIDGGGTKTHGVLFTDGEVKAEMKAGTTRIGAVGVGESSERTLNMIVELCNKAQIETSELDAVVIGVAGVWLEEEKKRSAQLIKTLARGQNIKLVIKNNNLSFKKIVALNMLLEINKKLLRTELKSKSKL